MNVFASRLKEIREKKKENNPQWTQGYVANKIGVARSTYTAYENGTKQPPLETVNRIAELLDVSTDYLLGRIDDEKPINIAFRDGGESITAEEEEYLQEQLETFRRMKKRFMEQRNKEKN